MSDKESLEPCGVLQTDHQQYEFDSSFFPLGILLITLVLGILAFIIGCVMMSAGVADLGGIATVVGGLVAIISLFAGILESMPRV